MSDAQSFMQKTPDFRDAYMHLVQGRDTELQAMGMTDPAQRAARIAAEERELAQGALAGKKSPSELLYNLAKARGYTAKAAQQDGKQAAMDKIEGIARGQKVAGASLSGAGGTSGEGLTVEALATMSDREFEAAMNKLSPSQRRQLMGG